MIVAPHCFAVLPGTAERFSSNNLSQIDARVIQLSLSMKKTHMKEILYVAVIVGQQAAWSGWGDYCVWAFVSCGEVSSSAHPIIKKKQMFFIIPIFCRMFSLLSSLMGVRLMFAASPLLVCDACCGFSVGAFTSAPPRQWSSHKTNVSSSEQLSEAHGARAASAPNCRKMRGTWSLLVGCWCGGVTPPHFPPVVVVPLMKHCCLKPAL